MLPEEFTRRMMELLGDEYAEFSRALEEPPVRGLRVNTLKCDTEDFISRGKYKLTPLPYCPEGFIIEDDSLRGTSPEHHAGEIYIQDPGAMSALAALDIKPDWRVLDLCSAPGGKSTQAAARLGDGGFILSNEFVPKRAKICVGNFERLGLRCAAVSSLDTSEFKKYYNAFFNLVIVDAPCSGEGMFRKSDEALEEWSLENVKLCAARQREILDNAASLVAAGGYLLYSTCTYSLEENEMTVDDFLSRHIDYSLTAVRDELIAATKDGIQFEGAKSKDLSIARRFYPHISRGEGQFVALMKRDENINVNKTLLFSAKDTALSREEAKITDKFFRENLTEAPYGRLVKNGENIVLIPHGYPLPPKSVFMSGVMLGEIRKSVFHPAHQFFSAYGALFKRKEHLEDGDERLNRYLTGEEIESRSESDSGYVAVFYGNSPLGGGKLVGGRIKNHYPKGLRNNK